MGHESANLYEHQQDQLQLKVFSSLSVAPLTYWQPHTLKEEKKNIIRIEMNKIL